MYREKKTIEERLTATATVISLVGTLEGRSRVNERVMHLRGWHRVPRLLPALGLTAPAGMDLSVHPLPGVGTIPSAELVALIDRFLAALLKRR